MPLVIPGRGCGGGIGVEGKRFIVQGFGNVGYHAASFLQEAGAVMIAVAEYDGAIHDPRGIDVEALHRFRQETGSVMGFDGCERIESSIEALELECDILIPAALENEIHSENVDRIRAKIIAEGANGPVTSEASNSLHERGVLIIPDTYLNAGGVTVSYFEWLKNLSNVRFGRIGKRFDQSINTRMLQAVQALTGKRFDEETFLKLATGGDEEDLVESGLEDTMVSAYHQIREYQRSHPEVDLRTAALIPAIDKIARA